MSRAPSRKATGDRKVPINVTIHLELLQSLDALVAEAGLSRSEFLCRLIEDYLDDAALARVAAQRMEAIQAGRDDTVSLDEAKRELLT